MAHTAQKLRQEIKMQLLTLVRMPALLLLLLLLLLYY